MSVRKLTNGLLAALAVTLVPTIQATLPGAGSVRAGEPDLPPADPFAFDPDFHWFEPVYDADLLDLRPKDRANEGWYATYDKLHLYGSRPDLRDTGGAGGLSTFSHEHKLDEGGGHRYEVGYMAPGVDQGWQFSYSNLDVKADSQFGVRRVNRLNEDVLTDGPEFGVPPLGFNALPEDGNDIGLFTRNYKVGAILNDVSMDSFEVNKTWRMIPFHYGGFLEPLAGFRYIRLDDRNGVATYARGFEADDVPPGGFQSVFVMNDPLLDDAELYTVRENETRNDILSGQFGFRYFKFQNRFRYSTELRVFTGISLQTSESSIRDTLTQYDGGDQGSLTEFEIVSTSAVDYFDGEEFFIGFDIRGEVGYQLTKMIHIRGGFQLIDLATGVWRGGQENSVAGIVGGDRDQNFLAFGGTFGLELNR